jgi:hypothetical protein
MTEGHSGPPPRTAPQLWAFALALPVVTLALAAPVLALNAWDFDAL